MKLQFIACVIVILVIIECESRPRRRIPATQKLSPEDLRQPPRQVRRSVAVPSDNIEKPRKADLDLEYRRYLDQVIEALESDPNFKKRLESLSQDDLEKGYIKSEELDLINHQIRSRLDVIKRREVERIRYLSMRQYEESQGMDRDHIKVPDHLDLTGGTFEREDLKLLIKAAAKDLDEVDRARKEDFKRYEMEKKFQREEQLKKIENELERRKEEQKIRQMEEKHKDHEKPHHPMTKDQLEEVWEEQDKMEAKDFDPKTFFALHDLNGDDHWDEDEVRVRANITLR